MFDELDIMLKETSNDIYEYQCMFECSLIEIGMEDDIYTEAEGDEKSDSIFKHIGEKLKELLDKVVERTNKAFGSLAQKLAEVAGKGSPEDKVADIQKAAGKDANFAKEVNDWIKKVEKGNYSSWDIMEEFAQMSKYLTDTDIQQIKKRLETSIKR